MLSVNIILPSPFVGDLTSIATVVLPELPWATVNLRLIYAGAVVVPISTWPAELTRYLSVPPPLVKVKFASALIAKSETVPPPSWLPAPM